MKLTRRHVLVSAAATFVAVPAVVRAQTLTTVRYASTPLVDGVPLFYAQQNGLFRREGLDVQITKLSNASVISEALIGGSVDIGEVTAQPLINAHMRGLQLQIVFPNTMHINGRPYNSSVVVSLTLDYHSGKDLNGQTVSTAAIGDSGWLGSRVLIDALGGDSSTLKYVEVPFSAVAAAIEQHRIAAGVLVDPYFSAAVKGGTCKGIGDLLSGFGPRLIQSTYSTTADYVSKNRDIVARFARVARAAHEYINAHRDDLVSYTTQFTGVEPARQSPDANLFTTTFTPKDLQPWIDAAVKYKLIAKGFDAADLFAKF